MGMVDAAGPKKRGGGVGVRKKTRVALRIDMTPMVDIAFLLVIFFMTTTRFREPQAIEITLPKPGKPKKTKQSNVLVIAINDQGKLNYKIGEMEFQPIELDSLEPLLNTLERDNILRQPNGAVWLDSLERVRRRGGKEYDRLLRLVKEDVSKLTVLIQVDPRSRYKSVIAVMDAVNSAKMARFSVIRSGVLEQEQPTQGTPGSPAVPVPAGPTGMRPEPSEYLSLRSS
ncbi:MAG: biopolymer transporter ExbD [candidate division WOR-3 bacterium]